MIAVIPKTNQSAVVEEFFQLFKTPWEFYREGQSYEVVVATAGEIPNTETRLLILYGADTKNYDSQAKLTVFSKVPHANLTYQGTLVPIYGDTLTFEPTAGSEPCVLTSSGIAGLKMYSTGTIVLRIGYDLFHEIGLLLNAGQPVEKASIPTLEIHIKMLRNWILEAGINLFEIPPVPAGHAFAICLTHDIDFVGIRNHMFDHTMWGFLYRSTVGAFCELVRGRISLSRLLKSWRAAMSLPLVYLGWTRDFWLPFDWYLQIEKGLPTTYFMIPYKNRAGEKLSVEHPKRRATAYDIMDISEWTALLIREGCEIGVHGIDSWHDVEKGREELKRIATAVGNDEIGVRMHWLLRDENSARVIEEAGYVYDSTAGYNESVGYRCGTTQAYRPLGAQRLLELPIHIQDGALFFSQRLGLTEAEAWKRCKSLLHNSKEFGGVLNIIWHDRSPGPERFWGDFYTRLVQEIKTYGVWFGTALQVVRWFQKRRNVTFEPVTLADGRRRVKLRSTRKKIEPPLLLRIHRPLSDRDKYQLLSIDSRTVIDILWAGEVDIELNEAMEISYGSQPNTALRSSES